MAKFQNARGTRDLLPKDMSIRKRTLDIVRGIAVKYGYEPLETPALETLSLLNAKCGEDVEKQIFRVEESDLGLRFDLTVPFARVVASYQELPKPFKRSAVAPVWRREEPQKGRFREFWQADIDVAGSSGMACEAELLACASECLSAMGFEEYRFLLNNRKILDAIVENAGVSSESVPSVFRSLDKLAKIGEDAVKQELAQKGVDSLQTENLFAFMKINGSNEQKISMLRKMLSKSEKAMKGISELEEILSFAKTYGIRDISIELSLVRGLDYYTGPIFEAVAPGGAGSIAGGGRYDNLIGLYGGQPTPAVGISFGIERIMDLIAKRQNTQRPSTLVFVANVKPENYSYAIKVAGSMREKGIPTQVDLMSRSFRKQLDYANAAGIRFVAVCGEKEEKTEGVSVKNLDTGESLEMPLDKAVSFVLEAQQGKQ